MGKKTVIAIAAAAVAIAAIIFNASTEERKQKKENEKLDRMFAEIQTEIANANEALEKVLEERIKLTPRTSSALEFIEESKKHRTKKDSLANIIKSYRTRIDSLSAALASIHQK